MALKNHSGRGRFYKLLHRLDGELGSVKAIFEKISEEDPNRKRIIDNDEIIDVAKSGFTGNLSRGILGGDKYVNVPRPLRWFAKRVLQKSSLTDWYDIEGFDRLDRSYGRYSFLPELFYKTLDIVESRTGYGFDTERKGFRTSR